MNNLLSIIIPAYNEEATIEMAMDTIDKTMKNAGIPHELLFVNDGSRDATWDKIKQVSEMYSQVRGINFSRNFGKESAMFAGLAMAKGDCCVIIDCDLQHPPEKIVEMYRLWKQGYEIVEGVKTDRGKESMLHSFGAKCFYSLISKAVDIDMSAASDFKLMDRKVVDVLLSMRERNAFFRALSSWVGFKSTTIEFEVQERVAGQSKWSGKALAKYAISNITSFSSAPMQIVTLLGGIMLLVSLILGVIALVQKFMGVALGGFTTVIIIQLFVGSIIMISLGIIGYYLAKMYDEMKARPRYIISEVCGDKNDTKTIG